MDNLSTCMVCEEKFKESQGVVAVYDATYIGQLDESGNLIDTNDADYTEDTESEHYIRPVIGWFELVVDFGGTVPRAVYCTECWGSLASHSRKLARQRRMDNSSTCIICGVEMMYESPDNFDPVCMNEVGDVHCEECCCCGEEVDDERNPTITSA